MTLNLTTSSGHPIQSKFQVCEVSKPLWSVGKICDSGCSVLFTSKGATITHDATGTEVSKLPRSPGGLYMANMPSGAPDKPAE